MNKIEQLIEKIIDDMGERPFAMTWETEARNMRKILKKHLQSLQEPTEEYIPIIEARLNATTTF